MSPRERAVLRTAQEAMARISAGLTPEQLAQAQAELDQPHQPRQAGLPLRRER